MSDEIVLQTVNLGKKYGARWAVQGLNLTVRRGEVFGFLGPNGAGKSTTIRMILSLITPSTGSVELFGLPLRGNRGTVLSRVGGLVERADFYLYLSARRNMEIVAALIGGISSSAIGEVLETVGLASRADDRVKSYSHGMKQRLGLAAALLGSPDLVVLDEPTGGLDPYGIKEVRDLIARLAAERNVTVFLSSHLLSEIEQLATSMAIINNGSLVVQGSVRDLLGAGTGAVDVDAVPADRALEVIRSLPYVEEAAPARGTDTREYPRRRRRPHERRACPCRHRGPFARPPPLARRVFPLADRRRRAAMSRSIVVNEILKTYAKWRTYIGFIAVGIVVPLVEFGLKAEGGSIIRNMTRGLGEDFLIVGNLFNAYFITYFIMNSLWIHVPFLISLVAGDQLAGEATGGTFRLMLIHPPSRTRILAAKYTTTLVYTLSLVVFLGLLALWRSASPSSGRGISSSPGEARSRSSPRARCRGALRSRSGLASGACGALRRSRSCFPPSSRTPSVPSSARWP